MQTSGCMAEYFTAAGYFYKTSTLAIEFVSKQPNTVGLFRSFELAYQCMESDDGDAEQEVITSIPTSNAPRRLSALQSVSVCFALQIVQ